MGIRTDGSLWGWGGNHVGQIGDGTIIQRLTPTRVGLDYNWRQVTADNSLTMAVRTNNTLWVWGTNNQFRLGVGTGLAANAFLTAPSQVGTHADWAAVASGLQHVAAIRSNGLLYSWGSNTNGGTGLGPLPDANTAVPTPVGGTAWTHASAGSQFTLAIRPDGTLWVWGANAVGQLGNGTNTGSLVPVPQIP